ncbi:hypothetical protein PILCRDRAFT_813940, partial [Piloderma croceum F 1598]
MNQESRARHELELSQMKKRITAIRARAKLKQRKKRLAQMNRVAKMTVWAPKT